MGVSSRWRNNDPIETACRYRAQGKCFNEVPSCCIFVGFSDTWNSFIGYYRELLDELFSLVSLVLLSIWW